MRARPALAGVCPVGGETLRRARLRGASERRLSDILPPPGAPTAGFADLAALRAAVGAGVDPVLYRAWRDILPPRRKTSDQAFTGDADFWYADLVVYSPGVLPDGQLTRSTGHWNSPAQLEIFQALAGTTLILTAHCDSGKNAVEYQVCHPGDLAVIPFGAWHVTFCLDGPAAVFNVYTDDHQLSGDSSRVHAINPVSKYHQKPGPEIAVINTAAGCEVVPTADPAPVAKPVAGPRPWTAALLPAGSDLAGLFVNGSDANLAAILRRAHDSAERRKNLAPAIGLGTSPFTPGTR
ncbi:MAG: hypothetical protein E6J41_02465 [Chloroflexi bacterium]|nr:MAG: hypothetical protein E6J41_02465 [Chloroflexota bacterium]